MKRLAAFLMLNLCIGSTMALECEDWRALHPDWIWCDDFEDDASLDREYFEVKRANEDYGVSRQAYFDGASSLKASYRAGVPESGNIKFSFGRSPVAPTRYLDTDFDDVYWRFYIMHEPGWTGNPYKLTRAMVFSGPDWSQAAIGHIWQNASLGLAMDPVSGVSGDTVRTGKYNDFANLKWLGKKSGSFEIFKTSESGKWQCIEVHMRLNSPGLHDGIFEFWINEQLQARSEDLDWRGSYQDYGINAIFLENFANRGMPVEQSRYMDNFVISTRRIGCVGPGTGTVSSSPHSARE